MSSQDYKQRHSTLGISTCQSGQPMSLPGTDTPQHHFVHIGIHDPDGRVVADGYLSTMHFMMAMMGRGSAPILLRAYASGQIKEEPEPPMQSMSALIQSKMTEHDSDVRNSCATLGEIVESMLNGRIKPTKGNLMDLKRAIENLQAHVIDNRDYVGTQVQRAFEEKACDIVGGLAANAQRLGLMTGSDLGEVAQTIAPLMQLSMDNDPVNPLIDPPNPPACMDVLYKPMEVQIEAVLPNVPIEDMTPRELAREIHSRLKAIEMNPAKNKVSEENPKPLLFHSSSSYSGRYIVVTYISYQGGSNLERDEAARYLKGLREGYVGRHYEFFRKDNQPTASA